MTGEPQSPLSEALALWLMAPVLWIVIATLFLGLELINHRLALFLPVTISRVLIAVRVQPTAYSWSPFPFMTQSLALVVALWVVTSWLASTIFMMICRKINRRRSRRRRSTRN